ncbi:MAG: polysaccharide deacetylase family protein [Acidobacteria bacterium]|nr:polysaccharide deacetylase family protein [Acidobacteriota bacterium]
MEAVMSLARPIVPAVALALAFAGCVGPRQTTRSSAVLPSSDPPAALAPREVPQFVCLGSDDNGFSGLDGSGAAGGMHFLTSLFAGRVNALGRANPLTYDGSPAHFSFYVNTHYLVSESGTDPAAYGVRPPENPLWIKRAWREAIDSGHEIGVHTHSHPHGRELSAAAWADEMSRCVEVLGRPYAAGETLEAPVPGSGLGVARTELRGFRTPYLEYSGETLAAARSQGFAYDCSLEEGTAEGQDGTNFTWPYRLDHGSPLGEALGRHPGLWEIPVYVYIVPPDDDCARLGVAPGLRARLRSRHEYFDEGSGKITGMDWNLWCEFGMTPAEFLATLRYTLELRLAGNRCPLTVGLHSELYSDRSEADGCATPVAERRTALAALLEHFLRHEEVRLVSHRELLAWLEHPAPL